MQKILLIILVILIALCVILIPNYTYGSNEDIFSDIIKYNPEKKEIQNALDNTYESWQNNTQIIKLINYPEYQSKLFSMLLRVYKTKYLILKKLLKRYKKDDAIFNQLNKLFSNNLDNEKRADYQSSQYAEILGLSNFKNYLDVGCGDGTTMKSFAEKINAENKYCIDIKPSLDKDINYHLLNPDYVVFPYQDNFMDLISCFMVLHHVKNLEMELKEIHRVLKPNGILYIREHDCENGLQAMLIDFEHLMYINLHNEVEKDPYMFHYKNYLGWVKYIEKFGFKLKKITYGVRLTNTRSFYAIFVKI